MWKFRTFANLDKAPFRIGLESLDLETCLKAGTDDMRVDTRERSQLLEGYMFTCLQFHVSDKVVRDSFGTFQRNDSAAIEIAVT